MTALGVVTERRDRRRCPVCHAQQESRLVRYYGRTEKRGRLYSGNVWMFMPHLAPCGLQCGISSRGVLVDKAWHFAEFCVRCHL